jgi:anti-sigma factor RsiW
MLQSFGLWEDNHLSDAALSNYVQGQLPPQIWLQADEHLASCEACRMRLKLWLNRSAGKDAALSALTQAFVRETIVPPVPRMVPIAADYPDFETMAAYIDGQLSFSETSRFESLLERFPALVGEVDELRALKGQLEKEVPRREGPPMVVQTTQQVAPTEVRSSKAWWERFLWPLQSLATTAVAAMLLLTLGVQPLQQELEKQRDDQTEQAARFRSQIELAKQENSKLRSQSRQFQNRLENQKQSLALRSRKLQRDMGALQNNVAALNAQLEREKREMERLARKQTANQQTPQEPSPRPTSPSRPASTPPFIADGDGVIARQGQNYLRLEGAQVLSPAAVRALRDGQLQEHPDLSALRSSATQSRGIGQRFHVLSPVATKVREVRPVLRWEKVMGATAYRIVLRDETAGSFIYSSQPVTISLAAPSWTVTDDLPRGHRFEWKVEAYTGQKLLATSPQKPDLAARFEVLSEADSKALEEELKQAGTSVLLRSIVMARFGVRQEAEAKLRSWRRRDVSFRKWRASS